MLHRAYLQPQSEALHRAVPELNNFREVMTSVHMQYRERDLARPKRLRGQVQHQHGVLSAGEQQRGALELGNHFSDDVDGFGFQQIQ